MELCFLTTDEGQRAEATQMLNAILEMREQGSRPQPAKIIKVLHTLAMLHYLSHNVSKASYCRMLILNVT